MNMEHQMNAKDLYRKAYRDARILGFQFPPQYPVSAAPIPLRFKLAARESIEADNARGATFRGYAWVSPTRQHHFELLTSAGLQY
jgi:hypothetical protein